MSAGLAGWRLAAACVAIGCGVTVSGARADNSAAEKLARLQLISAQVQAQVPTTTAPDIALSDQGRKEIEAALIQSIRGSAAHDEWKRGFIESSWVWHLWSTGLLFFLVLLIVCFGLYMTYVQFNRDYSGWAPPPQGGAATADGQPPPVTGEGVRFPVPASNTVKINAGGLELTSQVVGLLVLAFSLAFFYFYVHRVYPMQTEELTQLKDRDMQDDKAGKKGGEQTETGAAR